MVNYTRLVSRPKLSDFYTISQTKLPENYTLHSGIYFTYISITAPIWRENMIGLLSMGISCSEVRTVFRERSSRKPLSFEEQIMSKDKYLNIFLPKMEVIALLILQILFATRAVLKIGGYINNSLHLARKYARILFVRGSTIGSLRNTTATPRTTSIKK